MGYWRYPIVGYSTNYGYFYCPQHGVEDLGRTNKVERIVRGDEGWEGTTCDWPGCTYHVPDRDSIKMREHVNTYGTTEYVDRCEELKR